MSEVKRGIDTIQEVFNQPGSTHLPAKVEEVRLGVIDAFEEIITFGARARPLFFNDELVGYVRGLSFAEKGWITRMYPDGHERTLGILTRATSLPRDFFLKLSGVEVKRILLLVTRLSRADSSLLQWAFPYSTTSSSEKMYQLNLPPPPEILFPGGSFRPLAPSDVLVQWRFLASIRTETKASLRETSNAAMVVQAMVGKGAQQLVNEIKAAQKNLTPNLASPWYDMGIGANDFDPNDGWGHIHQDQSLDGLMREYWGMVNEDKHEQLMKEFALKHRERAEAERKRVQSLQNRVAGIRYTERAMTDAEVAEEEAKRKAKDASLRDESFRANLERSDTEETKPSAWDIEV